MPGIKADRLYRLLRGQRWLAPAYTCLAAALVAGVTLFVDLTPHVEQDFFFSSGDPAVRMDERISKLFPGGSQIVLSAAGDLASSGYQSAVARLSEDLARLPGVDGVQSVARGPKSLKHAVESPFWRRLLVGEGGQSTLVLVGLEEPVPGEAISRIEEVAQSHSGSALEVRISGVPYVVEQIRRNLHRDMLVFSGVAIVVFGAIISILFRSLPILLGTMVSCVSASCITLIATHLLDMRIGVLTANLVTIVFIMTLHHIVYLTFGWKQAVATSGLRGADAVEAGVGKMLAASGWVMLTTLLGFGSLLFVQAEPLRELGVSGALGAAIAFAVAYLVYPSFLHLPGGPASGSMLDAGGEKILPVFTRRHGWAVAVLMLVAALLATGGGRLNKDPSLLSYFARGGEIREGLEYVDRNVGSNPLRIVVRDASGARLDRKEAYRRLWAFQRDLESNPAVGAVISLPLIMTEAKRSPLGFLFSHGFLLERLEKPKYSGVTHNFVTEDRRLALFVLRMRESAERHDRPATVERIVRIAAAHGFAIEHVGGLYFLQGRLSSLVVSSLVTGVGQLLFSFLVIAVLVSRSLRWSLALVLTLGLVPAIVLGTLGYLAVPLDIISAPAINIALGMAIDDMLHMTELARSFRRKGAGSWQAWASARALSWKPLLCTATIVCAGFAIFALSSFPPTRRFGLAVVGGTLVDVLACLVVLPYLAGAGAAGKLSEAGS